jgi:cystathionine beta-synthase
LIKEEGMLVGGSSGTALAAAIQVIKEKKIGKGKRVVVIFPDSVRNYITKFLNNDWMYEMGFIDEQECIALNTSKLVKNSDWGQEYTVKDLHLSEAHFLTEGMTIRDAI